MKIINQTRHTNLAEQAQMADTFLTRLIGLLKYRSLARGEALIITRCQQIHMFFMRFAIDAVFLDRTDRVVGVVGNIKPYELSPIFWCSTRAIELPAGTIMETGTQLGDQIQILP